MGMWSDIDDYYHFGGGAGNEKNMKLNDYHKFKDDNH
jgi:hypothetical protein